MPKKTSSGPSVDERLTVALELIAAKFAELVELYREEYRDYVEDQKKLAELDQATRQGPDGPAGDPR